MKKTGLMAIFIIAMLLPATNVLAKQLKWDPVASTVDCVIAGYDVIVGIVEDVYVNSEWVKQVTWNGGEYDVGDALTYDLDYLEEDITHCLMVRAYSTTGQKGPFSDYVTYHPTSAPAKVEDVVGFNDGINAILNWTSGDKSCKVYYGLFSGQYFASEELGIGASFYAFPSWAVGYTIYTKVVFVDENGRESSEADEIIIEPLAIPEEVQGVTAVDDGSLINVSWNFSTEYVDNYKIYWSFFSGSYSMEPIIVSNMENFAFLTRYGMTMYIKVVGYNARGESKTWQEITVEPYTTPFEVTGVEVRKNSAGRLYASWDFALDAVTGYRVYASFWASSFPMAPTEVDELSNTALLPSYFDNYGAMIYVYVVAYNDLGESVVKMIVPLVPTDLVPDL